MILRYMDPLMITGICGFTHSYWVCRKQTLSSRELTLTLQKATTTKVKPNTFGASCSLALSLGFLRFSELVWEDDAGVGVGEFSMISILTSLLERCVLHAGTLAGVTGFLTSAAGFSLAATFWNGTTFSEDVAAVLNEGDFWMDEVLVGLKCDVLDEWGLKAADVVIKGCARVELVCGINDDDDGCIDEDVVKLVLFVLDDDTFGKAKKEFAAVEFEVKSFTLGTETHLLLAATKAGSEAGWVWAVVFVGVHAGLL